MPLPSIVGHRGVLELSAAARIGGAVVAPPAPVPAPMIPIPRVPAAQGLGLRTARILPLGPPPQ